MPFAVALLHHPAGAYAFLVAAIVGLLYAAQRPAFLPAFAGIGAGFLALLAFVDMARDPLGFVVLGVGIVLLHIEFLVPTIGAAGVVGVGAAAWGSWVLLAPLPTAARGAVALLGALMLLAAVARTMRLRTLPR
jgi:membrane-bound serine protease (ClpP class)